MRHRRTKTIPFGYNINPDDPTLLIPDEKVLGIIDQARGYYNNESTSFRNLIAWIQVHTGRKLSLNGLKKVMERKY